MMSLLSMPKSASRAMVDIGPKAPHSMFAGVGTSLISGCVYHSGSIRLQFFTITVSDTPANMGMFVLHGPGGAWPGRMVMKGVAGVTAANPSSF